MSDDDNDNDDNKPKTMRIPRALWRQMVDALRAAARDSRRDDRVLHDETREMVVDATDAATDWMWDR